MKLRHKSAHWPWFLLFTVVLFVAVPSLPAPYSNLQILTASVGGLWALAFYLQQRHAEDARFMRALMTDFNTRYDRMNNTLQAVVWSKGVPFTEKQNLQFIEYFNLCAEEWLFWRMGYIDEVVWKAWENGMRQYSKDERVYELWAIEAGTDSYYGFVLPR
jgi:hypothetical protein